MEHFPPFFLEIKYNIAFHARKYRHSRDLHSVMENHPAASRLTTEN